MRIRLSTESPVRKSRLSRILSRRLSWALLGLTFLTGLSGILLVNQITSVRNELQSVSDLVPTLRSDLETGDLEAVERNFEQIKNLTSSARSTTDGPLWKAAASIPFIGYNFSAVREVVVSGDDIAIHAVGPLLDKQKLLDWEILTPSSGRFDLDSLNEAEPTISTAAHTVRHSYQRMAALELPRLISDVADPIGAAREQLRGLADALDTASSVAQLFPSMLGAEGPRSYLVLVQNSSEVRATGGIPGALAMLHTDSGRIKLGEQSSAGALGAFSPMLDVDPEQLDIYTGRLGTQMQNVNLTPDFPTAAQLAKKMWETRHPGQVVDGVIALDPVVLSYLLQATGPLDLNDPQILSEFRDSELPLALTQENVVPTLLSQVYKAIEEPEAQDAYFAAVASRVFSALTEGKNDGTRLIRALAVSTNENRLYLWSSRPNEQRILASTPLHGSVVSGSDAGGTAFGVYFNDGTGAKMDYYMDRTVQLIQRCRSGEYSDYTVRVSVTNRAPLDAASTLPGYVTGDGVFGVEPGRVRTNYVVYGPAQSFVETAQLDGESTTVGAGRHGQRPVGSVQVEVGPGETAVLDVSFSRVVQSSVPQIHLTPTIQPLEDVILPTERQTCR